MIAAVLAVVAVLTPHGVLVDALVAKQREHNIPAMGLVLMDGNEPVLVQTFGAAPDTPFRLGSITKTFTALAMLELIDAGKIRLDDPAATWLADVYANPFDEPVRVRHLLELSAGFPDVAFGAFGGAFENEAPTSLSAALARNADARSTLWPPGFQHAYTNLAPALTSAIIERVSGLAFEDYLAAKVLRPIDMEQAGFHVDPALPGGFKADGKTEIPYWHMTFRAFGALNASVPDMAKFLAALLAARRPEMFSAGHTAGTALGLAVGYGIGMYGWVADGHVFHGHGGDADGYRSRFGLLPGPGRGYFVVINTDNPRALRELQRMIERFLTRDLTAAAPPPVADVPLKHYAGTYYPSGVRFGIARWRAGESRTLRISAADHRLTVRGRRTRTLIPIADGVFRRLDDPVATAVFVARDGRLYLQGEIGNYVRLADGCEPASIGFVRRCVWQTP